MSLLQVRELEAQLERRDARIAELEPDAARYRWLRDAGGGIHQLFILDMRYDAEEWDKYIDAAMKESAI